MNDTAYRLEPLEDRKLLSTAWSPTAQLINQDKLLAAYPYLTGAGQTVVLIDSGISLTHPQIGGGSGQVGASYKVIYGYNFDSSNTDISDYNGHGTGVAGIIAGDNFTTWDGDVAQNVQTQGIVKDAKIIMLKQFGSNSIKNALNWCIANYSTYHFSTINLTDFIQGAFDPSVYQSQLQTLFNMGVVITSPVGNLGPDHAIDLPAASPYDYGIGAVNPDGTWYPDTQRGAGLDFLAPGNRVVMPYYDVLNNKNILVDYAEGTSFASAHAAGSAALIRQIAPMASPTDVYNVLWYSGVSTQDPAHPTNYYRRIDLLHAANMAYYYLDDSLHGTNNTYHTAYYLNLASNKATLSNMKLLIGKPDWYTITIPNNTKKNVSIKLAFSSPTGQAAPTVQLCTDKGRVISNFGTNGFSGVLGAGKYYIWMAAPQSYNAPYTLTVTQSAASSSAKPLVVRAAASATFSTTAVFAPGAIGSAVLADILGGTASRNTVLA